jgi:hypothetical protein
MPTRRGGHSAAIMAAAEHRLGRRLRRDDFTRSPDWLKFKNPNAPAVKREAEEDWDREGWR